MKSKPPRQKADRGEKKPRVLKSGDTTYRRHRSDLTGRKLQSAITNGKYILDRSVDHRSALMRRLADLIADHSSDLGGDDNMSAAETVLVRRAAMLTLQCEIAEGRWVNENDGRAPPRSLEGYMRAVNTLRRTLESLGLKRRPRDITTPPNPLRYAAQFDAKRNEADELEEVTGAHP